MPDPLRLGVNIDHVATIRNARGGLHPDPVRAARLAAEAGADGITAHLREDRRHISDNDIARLKAEVELPLNLEMAPTQEMLEIALRTRPNAACIVPEKREELTTEGGLDVAAQQDTLKAMADALKARGIRVSLFVNADTAQLDACKAVGADIVELHTGHYCESTGDERLHALKAIEKAAIYTEALGIECHAGHGLCYDTVTPIAAMAQMRELNIGHFLVGEAIFRGLEDAISRMRQLMKSARQI